MRADLVPDGLWERVAPVLPPAPEQRRRRSGRLRAPDRALTYTASDAAIDTACRVLRLPTICELSSPTSSPAPNANGSPTGGSWTSC
ncbi:Transposase [Streptomyces venezuelae]|nr:Transposase [Streptomyces venezuelae]CUM44098.1 Mobile element protein [Streptomyces venezuelae]